MKIEAHLKELPIRRFTTVVSYLTEPTVITKDSHPIGIYTPLNAEQEAQVEEVIKKGIEKDQVKQDRGKLRKGLGDLPGEEAHEPKPTIQRDPTFGVPRPAPKPGK